MSILFNTEMNTNFNHSFINSSNVDIYVVPAQNRHLAEEFNVSTVNLTWNVISYEENELIIQLNFTDVH